MFKTQRRVQVHILIEKNKLFTCLLPSGSWKYKEYKLRDLRKPWKCINGIRQSKRLCMKPSGLGSFTLTLKSQRAVLDSFMNIQEDFANFSSLDDNCQQAVINSFYVNLYWCHTKNSDLPWNILSNILGSIITELWFPFNYKYNYFSLLWTFCQYNYLSRSHTKNKYSSVTVSNHVISL